MEWMTLGNVSTERNFQHICHGAAVYKLRRSQLGCSASRFSSIPSSLRSYSWSRITPLGLLQSLLIMVFAVISDSGCRAMFGSSLEYLDLEPR